MQRIQQLHKKFERRVKCSSLWVFRQCACVKVSARKFAFFNRARFEWLLDFIQMVSMCQYEMAVIFQYQLAIHCIHKVLKNIAAFPHFQQRVILQCRQQSLKSNTSGHIATFHVWMCDVLIFEYTQIKFLCSFSSWLLSLLWGEVTGIWCKLFVLCLNCFWGVNCIRHIQFRIDGVFDIRFILNWHFMKIHDKSVTICCAGRETQKRIQTDSETVYAPAIRKHWAFPSRINVPF